MRTHDDKSWDATLFSDTHDFTHVQNKINIDKLRNLVNIHGQLEFRRVFVQGNRFLSVFSPTNPPVLVSWMVSDLDLPMDPCEDTLLGDMGMTCFFVCFAV